MMKMMMMGEMHKADMTGSTGDLIGLLAASYLGRLAHALDSAWQPCKPELVSHSSCAAALTNCKAHFTG